MAHQNMLSHSPAPQVSHRNEQSRASGPGRPAGLARSPLLEGLLAGGIAISRNYDVAFARACLTGQTVLITGASSGIGRALALKLGALGARLILVARSQAALGTLELAICGAGGWARAHPADLSTASGVASLLAQLAHNRIAVDVLVNNAGRSIRRSLAESYSRSHDYQRTMAINYFGALQLTLGLLPGMCARKRGHVVNISSTAVPWASPHFSAYGASKAALDAFARVAAIETYRAGVRWSTIHMPLVRTPMSAPTREFARLPALSAEQAADVVIRALLTRETRVGTRRSTLIQLAYVLAPNLTLRLLARLEQLSAADAIETSNITPLESNP